MSEVLVLKQTDRIEDAEFEDVAQPEPQRDAPPTPGPVQETDPLFETASTQSPTRTDATPRCDAVATTPATTPAVRPPAAPAQPAATADAEHREVYQPAAGRPEAATATRLAVKRAVGDGASLRVENRGGERRYLVVDDATQEIRRDWAERDFFDLVRGVRADVYEDVDAGMLLADKI